MTIIICENYGSLKPVIALARRFAGDSPRVVIPSYPNLAEFLRVYSSRFMSSKLDITELSCPARNGLSGLLRERQCLRDIFDSQLSSLRNEEVFFFSRGFSPVTVYLLQKLGQRNRLVYLPLETSSTRMEEDKVFNLRKILWRALYGKAATAGSLPYYKNFVLLSDAFMKEKVQIWTKQEVARLVDGCSLGDFSDVADQCELVYYDDDLSSYTDSEVYNTRLSEAFGIVSTYFSRGNVGIKHHPSQSDLTRLSAYGRVLPSYLPAETLYSENTKVHMTVMSWSVSKVETGLVISLLDLILFKNSTTKRLVKAEFMATCKIKPLFPQTLRELDAILTKIRGGMCEIKAL